MSETFNDNPTKTREDEELDNSRLSNYLSNFFDISKSDLEILQFPSGFSNLTYLIKSNQKEYILRKPPFGAKVKSGHDMSSVYKVIASTQNNYKKTPRQQYDFKDINILASDFYIMESIR